MLNQVLRQCKFRKNPALKQDFSPAVVKQRAMKNLRTQIIGYANLSTVAQERDPDLDGVNNSNAIAASYLVGGKTSHKRNHTIDVTRVSQESASVYDS